MDGLRQIQVITQGDGWHLVGLDAEGQCWFGSPRRTAKGRRINWVLMEESVESEEPPPTTIPEPLDHGGTGRAWPTKPRP